MNPQSPFEPQPGSQPFPPQPSAPSQTFSGQPMQPLQSEQPMQPMQPAPQPMGSQPGYTPVPPTTPAPMRPKTSHKWLILAIVFIFTTLVAGGVAVWSYLNYRDQKFNTDSKISTAVAAAVKTQADKDAADFLEKEKQPNRQFTGPSDYGTLSFDYPKTWSVYEAKDATSGGTYEAYFNPGVVPPISSSQQYALHVTIEDKDYDKVVETYKSAVSKGDLVSSSFTVNEQTGTRLDGAFTKDIRGQAVIFKIRDKTVTIRSDATTFKQDFDALVQSINFVK
jgi:hypothetical protein